MFGDYLGIVIFGVLFFVGVFGLAWCGNSLGTDKSVTGILPVSIVLLLVSTLYLVVEFYEWNNLDQEKLSNAYVMYRAYDDGEFSEEELDVIGIYMEDEELLNTLASGNVEDRDLVEYETFVNDTIDVLDESEGNFDFKEYVLVEREGAEFMKLRDVSYYEWSESDLVRFAEDILDAEGADFDHLIDSLEYRYSTYAKLVVREEEAKKKEEDEAKKARAERSGTFEIKK